MGFSNAAVKMLLQSPAHRLLSGSTDVVRYRGRKSGTTFSTPTQYVRMGDDLVLLVGRAATKSWWRNFREDHELEVLVQGDWLQCTGRAVIGADEPEVIAPLLDAYVARFPKATRALDGDTPEDRARHAVVVWCRPR